MDIIVYRGNGAYISGVPARNMTLDEWHRIPAAKRANALDLGLYQLPTPPKATRKGKATDDTEEVDHA